MLATSKQLHNMVRNMADITGNVWGRRTWTDRRRAKGAKANERYVVFKFGDERTADFVADELREIYKLTGITAKVTRTTTNVAEYVRTIGTIG